MFDFGFSEFIFIIILVIIIIPGKDMPKLLQQLGAWYKRFTTIYHGFMNEIQDITDDAKEMIENPIDTKTFRE
jgi:Sec-independent protein translocase protein TatA